MILMGFLSSMLFTKGFDRFYCLKVISLRHRHADMDMQTWLGTWRWEWQIFSIILKGFLIWRWSFQDFERLFYLKVNFLWDIDMQTLIWDLEVGMTSFFHDFDRVSNSERLFFDFNRFSDLIFVWDFDRFLIWRWFFQDFGRFWFEPFFSWDIDMQTWICGHDLGLGGVISLQISSIFFYDFDR